MRGSRLIPIRVSGIIHGDAEITARRGGLVRDASVGDQVARHSTARGTAAAPSQQTNASKEQSGESGTRYRRRGGLVRDASVGDQVARHSTARGTAAAPSQQTNASKEQSGESGTRYRTGNANRSDESAPAERRTPGRPVSCGRWPEPARSIHTAAKPM
jgi:hypothetical protein